jgi:CubicO group peptidase (beta-lactamase class C family)
MRLVLSVLVACALGAGIYFAVADTSPSQPPAVAPGWRTAAPTAVGMDPTLLARAAKRVAADSPSVDALLVARHGRIVLERYFHGYGRDYPFDVYSITKSFTSALVGIAVGERRIRSVDQRLVDFLPPDETRDLSAAAQRVTLRRLLTMTAGFPGDGDPRGAVGEPRDFVRALLRRPIEAHVRHFVYDTGSFHLLSAALSGATGMPEEEYARRHLLGPLGIRLQEEWPRDAQQRTFGGNGLSLPARDLAKLGQLYLDDGRAAGRQLVPRAWVRESTRPRVAAGRGAGYGYGWWTFSGRSVRWYAALGFGGQMLAVVPSRDLLVVVYSEAAGAPANLRAIVERLVLPAVRA